MIKKIVIGLIVEIVLFAAYLKYRFQITEEELYTEKFYKAEKRIV